MKAYKKDQGRHARMAAFWALALLLLFGCTTLHRFLVTQWTASLGGAIGGIQIPIVNAALSPAMLVSAALFVAGMLWLIRYQQQPKVADLLIDTEAELRKVTWPGLNEVVDSSLVVILCVGFLMAFLAASDWFLARVFDRILVG